VLNDPAAIKRSADRSSDVGASRKNFSMTAERSAHRCGGRRAVTVRAGGEKRVDAVVVVTTTPGSPGRTASCPGQHDE